MSLVSPPNRTNVRATSIRAPRAPRGVSWALRAAAALAPDWTAARLLERFLRTRRPGRRAPTWIGPGAPLPLVDGPRAVARVAGDGPVVHLLHGWDGSAEDWRTLGPALVAAGHRVVALEAPGHGDADGERAHLRWFADTLSASVERFGPGPVVAHSFGAAAAGLAAADGLPDAPYALLAPEPDPAEWLLAASSLGGPRLQTAVLSAMGRLLRRAADGVALADHLPPDALVVHDTDDRQVRYDRARRALPGLVTTAGLGHRGVLHHPSVVAAVVAHVSRGPIPPSCAHGRLVCPSCELERSLYERDRRAA